MYVYLLLVINDIEFGIIDMKGGICFLKVDLILWVDCYYVS